LREAVGYFQTRGLPFAAWLGPDAPAEALREVLGPRSTEVEVGMVLDRADFRPRGLPTGLMVERATDPARLADFAGGGAGEGPDASVLRFYEQPRPALLRSDCPARLLVGYWDGQPVASAEVFLSEGTAGVYGVATHPSHRRRGIGTAMTARAVEEGFGAG